MTTPFFEPFLASSALQFAFEKSTLEGKLVIFSLLALSLFSWTVIITKLRQLFIARRTARKFFAAYESSRDPLEILKQGQEFEGAPAYQVYIRGADELKYQLENHPKMVDGQQQIGTGSLDAVKVTLEEATGSEALNLEKGMIVLSTAVAGGPFIGLLGTVWGVMDTFAGVALANAASLTAMAPGVAGALITTVVGLLVAIPAMFAFNYMVTTLRAITQELDGFASRFVLQIEHHYVEKRNLEDKIADALRRVAPVTGKTQSHRLEEAEAMA